MQDLFKKILTSRVYEAAIESSLDEATALSARLNNRILLKREDQQPVFSFKIRGAYNKIAHLDPEQRKLGVITASAGNHAQGVAFGAQKLGIRALIVMPVTTPRIKIEAVKRLGGQVVLHGNNYSEAAAHADQLQQERGLVSIHPFDDKLVIAGQGTIGVELLRQNPGRLDAVFLPIGGGGLIAGVGLYLKTLRPEIKIIGVEPEDSDAMHRSLSKRSRITLDSVGIFADGVAVRRVGKLTYNLCRKYVDEIVTVTTDELCSGIKNIYLATRSIVEPAGGLGMTGVVKYIQQTGCTGRTFIAINSGANMNFERLRYVAERTLIGEKQEALFAVTIPERPGALKRFCTELVGRRNITEFNYRLASRDRAHIFVGITISNKDERVDFAKQLDRAGYDNIDLTDNDLAKTHVRYMVGGKSDEVVNERVFRFWFPETPGALARFLKAIRGKHNISLFHYRAQGGDFGRVLIGLECPNDSSRDLANLLDTIGYRYQEETDNAVYDLFL
ncbi:threonine ammonia-lyase, biosynthetic [Desulforhopalus singaporensis]|uniref:L-threonine dehydratase n=1 Tax=Desulforhopalus singaporensis TaxID=91360 RepID=A0A1H0Q7M6_9BACT|nr:threonine ammonia-lyase, biosynthetic [Desulforhopalus singaporensis]SDP13402.1 L-threonine ammonia-lyase [Desulforhopalus singaporensis]